MAEQSLQNDLIDFMFLRSSEGELQVMDCLKLWFGKSNETDATIRERFGSHISKALAGGYDHWQTSPRGCLALMILIDQFPRSIYRHNARSFAGDQASRRMVHVGHDWLHTLLPEECIFVPCLILTHQENLADQDYCLQFYDLLEPKLSPALHIFRSIFEEHHRIIKLCGTFPHRDHYYNRRTSEVGKQLLDNPTIRFDLPLCYDDATGTVTFGRDPAKLWKSTQQALDMVDRIEGLISNTARRRSSVMVAGGQQADFDLSESFRTFDKDGSGFLDIAELEAVLCSTGRRYSNEQLQDVVDRITGEPGCSGLSLEQFASLLRIQLAASVRSLHDQRFAMFDSDQSGEISLEEFTACVQTVDELVTSAEAAMMFRNLDQDGNGSVSFDEFIGIMSTRSGGAPADAIPPTSTEGKAVRPGFNLSSFSDKSAVIVKVNEVCPGVA